MNELVIINNGQALTTSLVIAEGVSNSHATVIRLIRENLSDLEEFGLVGFEIQPRLEGKRGGSDTKYALLNEQQATLLMTYMRNSEPVKKFKKALVKAFYELAKRQKPAPANLSRMDVLQIAIEAERENEALKLEVAETKPKAEALDRLAGSDGSCCITVAAKNLRMAPKKLFKWLGEHNWIYRRSGNWAGYQSRIDQGLLEHKPIIIPTHSGDTSKDQVRVTPKGLAKLAELLQKDSGG